MEDDRRAGARRAPRASARPPCSRASTAASDDGCKWRSSSSSRWIVKRLSSAWSSRIEPPRRARARSGGTARTPIEPPAPGDEHDLAGEVGADAVELHAHRLAAEHVLDLHLAQLPGERAAAAQQLEDGRQGAHRDAALAAGARRPRARSVPGADGIAMITSSGSASSRMRGSCVGRAEHLHAVDAHAALARVVVDEADRAQPELAGCARSRAAAAGRRRRRRRSARGSRPCGARKPRIGRSAIACADEARAADERERQQQEQRDDAGRDADVAPRTPAGDHVTGLAIATRPTTASVSTATACEDAEVVALGRRSATASARSGTA